MSEKTRILAKIVAIDRGEESECLTLENLWLPQCPIVLDVPYGGDFEVGQTVRITVEDE